MNEIDEIDEIDEIIITPCPHCFEEVLVYLNNVNCGMFRHAVFISSGELIPSNFTKEVCERLIEEEKVYGCGKLFQIIFQEDGKLRAEICD